MNDNPETRTRIHLAYRRAVLGNAIDTRCGTGDKHAVTEDESLVTCPLCLYWAHRGMTAPENAEKRHTRALSRAGRNKPPGSRRRSNGCGTALHRRHFPGGVYGRRKH